VKIFVPANPEKPVIVPYIKHVLTTGDEAFEACLGTSGRRSPLWV
jgi:hypothetical protein